MVSHEIDTCKFRYDSGTRTMIWAKCHNSKCGATYVADKNQHGQEATAFRTKTVRIDSGTTTRSGCSRPWTIIWAKRGALLYIATRQNQNCQRGAVQSNKAESMFVWRAEDSNPDYASSSENLINECLQLLSRFFCEVREVREGGCHL